MFDKLAALEERFELVSEKISDPDVINDQEVWRKYCKELIDFSGPHVHCHRLGHGSPFESDTLINKVS